MKIGIIGYGHVGKSMHAQFKKSTIYDPILKIGSIDKIKKCDAIFICVPTPIAKNGSCDTSIVETYIKDMDVDLLIIRSTVPVKFTESMSKKYKKNIVFQPEYYGETVDHPFKDSQNKKWLTFGGDQKSIDKAINVYKEIINSNIKIIQAPSNDIEMAKYMENAFFALKVSFCNEMANIAKSLGANYNQAREAWLADPRINSSHTFVYENNPGYDGKCLPKDIASIIYQADSSSTNADILKAVVKKNELLRK